jgi:hypothetical protein
VRRVIAHARALGLAAWLSLCNSITHPRPQHCVVLRTADPLSQLPAGPGPDRELAVVEHHKHRDQAGGGRPAAALADRLGCALADGLGVAGGHAEAVAGEALRSDGQVVPSSFAAALTLPSCWASWKARSAWARSVRKRLGRQPTHCWASHGPLATESARRFRKSGWHSSGQRRPSP